jgi:hypothetical protein
MPDIPVSRRDILKATLRDPGMNYNMVSIKLHQNGIYWRMYFNFKDIKQFIKTARTMDSVVNR